MADRAKKISEVPAVTSVVSTDLFVVVANAAGNAVTSRITLGSLANTLGISNTSSANLTYSVNKITTPTLSVGNSTINTAISATANATLAIGNTTVTGFVNISSDLTVSGNIVGNTAGFEIGFRDRPQILLTANTTIANTARTRHYYEAAYSNVSLTIANNASIPMPVGTQITIVTTNFFVSVIRGSGVDMVTSNNQTSADRTISPSHIATLLKVDTNKWFISGTGLA